MELLCPVCGDCFYQATYAFKDEVLCSPECLLTAIQEAKESILG